VKRLLLVTYYFPPLAGPGVFRPLRLAKYLPREGWDVTVLTVSESTRAPKDPSLLQDVPESVRVERTGSFEPRTAFIAMNKLGLQGLVRRLQPWLMLPDDQVGWVRPAVRGALRILHETRHDVIVTTSAPYSAHLIGKRLQGVTGTPWIADFRDEWTTNPYLEDRYPTRWHLERNRSMERAVLGRADRVVCVSQPWLDTLRGLVPDVPDERFVVMPNGFDGDHFLARGGQTDRRFRIVYTGMFYGPRSPRPFLEAWRRVVESGRIPSEESEVVLMGRTSWEGQSIEPFPAGRLRIVEQRPYFETLELLQQAAALLLVIPREGGKGNHTGKLFPYLASGRPILALAPESNVAADLIRKSKSGIVAPPDDPDAIAQAIEALYHDWKRGGAVVNQERETIEAFEASRQAADWARLLERTADPVPR
jgi:glycosyltransferase involved in cell wall biosynthesis